ncbi:MAG: cytidine deaminase [Bdellovibrionales bacterium]|nr:cytidine deaminase [Bdellovibrionales bacterium]
MSSTANLPAPSEKLSEKSKAAQARSHSPYSGFKVGAAIELEDGQIFEGCNVENSSYGGTVCAERTAIFSAVAKLGGGIRLKQVVVYTEASPPWPPCGLCRQVIAEFGSAKGQNVLIHAINHNGERVSHTLQSLFPNAFTPDHLKKG